jgi:hypothetical protein
MAKSLFYRHFRHRCHRSLSISAPYHSKQRTSSPITVSLANNSKMISSHEVELSLPNLPPSACTAHLFPALGDTSLISSGQLCDAGCLATFSSSHVDIALHGTTILSGTRSLATNRLWTVELPQAPDSPLTTPFASSLQTGTVPDLVAFAHAALFSPSLSTLSKALSKNYISNFPGLSQTLLSRHPPNSVDTAKGHLDQVRRSFRSTKKPKPSSPPPWTTPYFGYFPKP